MTQIVRRHLYILFLAAIVCLFFSPVFAHPEISTSEDNSTVYVGDAPEQHVVIFGKGVVVQKRAKGIVAIGGDVTVEGSVEGDVATIGGNVIQKEKASIGGDVIVVGGTYKAESATPIREEGKQTMMFAAFEGEIREMAQNPSQIFTPELSVAFFTHRLLLAIVWFVISLIITTLAPGAVSRASARLHLSPLKVGAAGAAGFILGMAVIIGGAVALPNFLSVVIGSLAMFVLVFGYVFGRIALQIILGRAFLKLFSTSGARSETLTVVTGILLLSILLSMPYVWVIAVFAVFAFGIGLVLTARNSTGWSAV